MMEGLKVDILYNAYYGYWIVVLLTLPRIRIEQPSHRLCITEYSGGCFIDYYILAYGIRVILIL